MLYEMRKKRVDQDMVVIRIKSEFWIPVTNPQVHKRDEPYGLFGRKITIG